MALSYSHDIHLRPGNLARALTEVARPAPPGREVPPLTVTLPGGDRVVLPFTSRSGSKPVDCSAEDTLELDTSLMFPADDAVRAYARECGHEVEDGRVRIGYVCLTIRFRSFLHPDHASMEFWAATSRMSRLFARSARVREVFTSLAAAAGGTCCLFDIGDGSPEQVCRHDGETAGDLLGSPLPAFLSQDPGHFTAPPHHGDVRD
jgi:hypothetical protein